MSILISEKATLIRLGIRELQNNNQSPFEDKIVVSFKLDSPKFIREGSQTNKKLTNPISGELTGGRRDVTDLSFTLTSP